MLGCGRKMKAASPSARAPMTAVATAGRGSATRLEVEARDRDQEDCEVGLRQDPAEERADRIGQEVREAGEDQAGQQDLAAPPALERALPVADEMARRGGTQPDRGHDVVLAVEHD